MNSKIPNNRGGYVSQEIIDTLASYDESKMHKSLKTETEYYWFDNSAWSASEPLGIMSKEDAEYSAAETKYISFIDFDTTIPAITKEQLKHFNYCLKQLPKEHREAIKQKHKNNLL